MGARHQFWGHAPGRRVIVHLDDRQSVLWAAIVENIDGRDFDILEEARAVELMVEEIGNATEAARTPG